ncbi:hypothetical protein [Thalassomonas actiniarum]|uniref:Lipoprotein n=1 Tax=Thalassomonas actiniarum TaxID=485447 RepID=A0AAF0C6W9_9GAMM|nr:hypothetical protein [Thalassomonas actiniarum]WDE02550.1 hypothetical protein SG35_029540 [Thalassomonas actiniarum]
MKNKKVSAALLALTFGIGLGASSSAIAHHYSYQYCTALFQSCEYMGNMLACENFDRHC